VRGAAPRSRYGEPQDSQGAQQALVGGVSPKEIAGIVAVGVAKGGKLHRTRPITARGPIQHKRTPGSMASRQILFACMAGGTPPRRRRAAVA